MSPFIIHLSPSDPPPFTHTFIVITDGRRQALPLHTNKAYGDPKPEPQATQQPNKKEEHIYESIN